MRKTHRITPLGRFILDGGKVDVDKIFWQNASRKLGQLTEGAVGLCERYRALEVEKCRTVSNYNCMPNLPVN